MRVIIFTIVITSLLFAIYRASLPRGIRNNNPGNIKLTSIQWQGMQQVQNDKTFVQFIHPRYGFRAMTRILRNYQKRGVDTVRQIVSTYAPKDENDTEAYINFIANELRVQPDEFINIEKRLFDLLKAIHAFENGSLWQNFYDDQVILEGVQLA